MRYYIKEFYLDEDRTDRSDLVIVDNKDNIIFSNELWKMNTIWLVILSF